MVTFYSAANHIVYFKFSFLEISILYKSMQKSTKYINSISVPGIDTKLCVECQSKRTVTIQT